MLTSLLNLLTAALFAPLARAQYEACQAWALKFTFNFDMNTQGAGLMACTTCQQVCKSDLVLLDTLRHVCTVGLQHVQFALAQLGRQPPRRCVVH